MPVQQYKYIIVGAGLAGGAAVEGIRELDTGNSILLIGAEPDSPYDRPPLSKQLWKGEQKIEEIFKHDRAWYLERGVELRLGQAVVTLDAAARLVKLADGSTCGYERLLLATGGVPRRLPIPGGDLPGICYFRTAADYRSLRECVRPGVSALVVGNGFIGSEMAAALTIAGGKVSMIFPAHYLCQHVFPQPLARAMNDLYQSRGIELFTEDRLASITQSDAGFEARSVVGRVLRTQIIVAGVGIASDTALASDAGLRVGDGIEVDAFLRTSDSAIYAAGDLASFPAPVLGRRRIEHWDNAASQGRHAGRNLAGAGEPFTYMPFFFSDLFEFGYEAVGECHSDLETFADWVEPNKTGVIYYLRDSRVRGVMTCGIFGKTDAARAIILSQQPDSSQTLKGRIRPD